MKNYQKVIFISYVFLLSCLIGHSQGMDYAAKLFSGNPSSISVENITQLNGVSRTHEKSLLKAINTVLPVPWNSSNKSAKISANKFFTQDKAMENLQVKVYPNPVHDYLNITTKYD